MLLALGRGGFTTPSEVGVSVPPILAHIARVWADKARAHGDKGACVAGEGFEFDYAGTRWQLLYGDKPMGSLGWEAAKDDIEAMLRGAGCTNIRFRCGWLD